MLGPLGLDHVEVVDVAVARCFERQRDIAGVFQARRIAGGPFTAQVAPFVDVLELGAENAGVEIVQPAVDSKTVAGPLLRTVIAEPADHAVDEIAVRDHGAAIAESAEVLLDDEAGANGIAELADLETVAFRADALRVILHH